ncbi:ABC transporter ATP-binding protein [Pelagibius sp. Alg239-R121]|uniref:ABC transporter ATP-binding protein n=1 Tax=Pelagibius sp. Alg239-R121 TaxID=2993448 RepID=UPI0024A79893|nr:ABC transporter ATP-binding protein [Pelagibius sp. Alg239-R121]
MSTIEATSLTKNFGSFTAVRDVDLSVGQGEVVCLLGPSGCGKTTTLRMIAGLESVTEGEVRIGGKLMNKISPEKRDIAMVFQFYALYPSVSIGGNIEMPLFRAGLSAAERRREVARVAGILQLDDVLDRLPGQVSEGEKQRAAVARAIVRDPNCFLFDEPLSRLDVELRHSMRGQIKEVLSGLSKATVIVTHDQLEALTMANRIAIMRDGMIEQIGTPHEVFSKPRNIFVAGFIGSPKMNLFEGRFSSLSGDMATIELSAERVTIPVPSAVSNMQGETLTLGVRPRALEPVDSPNQHSLTGQVELIEPMGAETLVHVRDESDQDLRVVVPRHIKVIIGEVLHLACDLSQTHIFDGKGLAVR